MLLTGLLFPPRRPDHPLNGDTAFHQQNFPREPDFPGDRISAEIFELNALANLQVQFRGVPFLKRVQTTIFLKALPKLESSYVTGDHLRRGHENGLHIRMKFDLDSPGFDAEDLSGDDRSDGEFGNEILGQKFVLDYRFGLQHGLGIGSEEGV